MDLTQILMMMKDSIFDVFDNMLFLPVGISQKEGEIAQWLDSRPDIIGTAMPFEGPVNGEFLFLIPGELAMEITTNFLGLDSLTATQDQVEDTVKEALNMVGGHSLSQLDTTGEFNLNIPDIVDPVPQRYALFAGGDAGRYFLESDTHHLLFAVRIRNGG
jgi:CheY-specific phosphatase CheX